jgi:formylglycine-generating enzyme
MNNRFPPQFPPPWASAWGDDQYGLWSEITVGEAVQRLRWIEPGSFLMGSLENESYLADETPQHKVTLTEGFWLADTACTQALWVAVMGGKNPSAFTNDLQLPVEQVSWDDVADFCSALAAHLPNGCGALLPTEAQWEYACRADTKTAFSFGDNISTAQVNYDGNRPYKGAPKGEYRETTVPVKALPANPWGLYQMHGNVWEWCADAPRPYSADAALNPSGATGKGVKSFAIRGGSWIDDARHARSACRSSWPRGLRSLNLGFRFALRSTGAGSTGAPEAQNERSE